MKKTQLKNNYFYKFSTCIFVKGNKRGIIYDLQREDYEYVPNTLIELFESYNGSTLKHLYDNFEHDEEHEIIDEYLDLLLEKEFIFLSDMKFPDEAFPELITEFKSPYKISNLIIDVNQLNFQFIDKIINEIESLGCGSILLRVLNKSHFKYLMNFVEALMSSSCRSIIIHVNDFKGVFEELQTISKLNSRIFNIVLFNCKNKSSGFDKDSNFYWTKVSQKLFHDSPTIVYHTNFNTNITLYAESYNYNPYYNRKVYIDYEGSIKNSPETSNIFGNISKNSIEEILDKKEFNYLWFINKDSLGVCRECEYRYMCLDPRVPKYNKNLDTYLFNRECNYNPYTNQWKDAKEVSEYKAD